MVRRQRRRRPPQNYRVSEGTGKTIALVYEPDETAELIVRAVNAHDDLVVALREFIERDLSDARALARKIIDSQSLLGHEKERAADLLQSFERCSRIARAALAKAGS